jgi:hypothetical protein
VLPPLLLLGLAAVRGRGGLGLAEVAVPPLRVLRILRLGTASALRAAVRNLRHVELDV